MSTAVVTRVGLVLGVMLACACRGEPPKPPPAPVPTPVVPSAPPPSRQTDVTAEDYRMPRLPAGRVTVAATQGKKVSFDVEVAATRDSRTRGLMWRYALPETAGMLFIFPREQPLSFWMRNTLIPLDMLFIDAKGKVVSIVENAEPRTLSSRPSTGPATYVLEVPGGTCAKKGLKAGAQVTFEGISNIVPED
ncbi:MAG: DUF192 domain-containing protein [Myxococcaceae bacterium]|nr:DUF192 domain-containing protein [Myxococcaceae bacterium]